MNVSDFRRTAPTFLNLLHTDHTIRTEAGSIFYKEYLPVDHYKIPLLCACPSKVIVQRVRAISSLVSLRVTRMQVSIRPVCELLLQDTVRVGIDLANYISRVRKDPVLTDWQLLSHPDRPLIL